MVKKKKAAGHQATGQQKSNFTKDEIYRKNCLNCGFGYHGHRWEAHHVLPGVVFTWALEQDVDECIAESLDTTPYDINDANSLLGLPKLTAYILFYQNDPTMQRPPKAKELTTTMARWKNGSVGMYQTDIDRLKSKAATDPGNLPVHTPVNWGHTEYNKMVYKKLDDEVFEPLRTLKAGEEDHFEPQDVYDEVNDIKNACRSDLLARGMLPGVVNGALGVKANLKARHDSPNKKYWIPLCMVDVDEPAS